VRGHQKVKRLTYFRQRTIPAGAGTPLRASFGWSVARDYPRGCGDTANSNLTTAMLTGLSPRVRGHPQVPVAHHAFDGTIPAGAGTPSTVSATLTSIGDYPRGCGDTALDVIGALKAGGLSPRVRGHRGECYDHGKLDGTIPAGAGTPACRTWCGPGRRDYPRGCGDTSA